MIEPPLVHLDSSRPRPGLWRSPLGQPELVLRCDGNPPLAVLYRHDGSTRHWTDPLAALGWMSQHARSAPPAARWIGFLSYDLGRYFEQLPASASDDLRFPLFCFTFHDNAAPIPPRHQPDHACSTAPLRCNFSRAAYETAVSRAVEHIAAGDIFQVNLSQRFTAGLPCQPLEIYQRLLASTPAHYGAYLDYGDFALVCNSPELFLQVDPDRRVITRPIKGTRPLLPGMEAELLHSVKDQAELNMIVDLERNDLGRVCVTGSIKVSQPRIIEPHPTVYHGVATVQGQLRPDVSFVDLLRATFPGGSITGAPKIRAMQIIEELEQTRRGPYCGAIGLLAPDGSIELNIAIRTILVKSALAHVCVGGGIVADSTPAAEYEETLVKARAMFAALGVSAG